MIAHIPKFATLEDLSAANPGWKVEREADGSFTMSPTGTRAGLYSCATLGLLWDWNRLAGGKLFDSGTGFTMPDKAILSPDAAWISRERWAGLDEAAREGYSRIVPDVCVEVVSPTDSVALVLAKLQRYRSYGAAYVVLVDPQRRAVWTDGEPPAGFPADFRPVFDAAE